LIAGSGLATLVGGKGNDTFVINNVADVITEAANSGKNIEQSSVSTTLAPNVQNLTGTGTAAITLTGNTLANVITANSAADTLIAGSGLATLVGGSGNDTFVINNSSDVITVTSAKAGNVVQSSVNYVLPANLLNLNGTGTGNISLTGNVSANTITANSGNDTLTAGSGLATLIGGSGNDTFVVNSASDVITEAVNAGNNTEQTSASVTLATNVQNLSGTGSSGLTLTGNSGNDVITANSGADKLVAGSGNDTLIAGTGNDTLTGGAGNDVFNVNNTADVVTAIAGSNVNTINTTVSYTASTNVQDLFGSGSGTITLTGNGGNDLIVGGTGTENLVGGSATSVLEAGTGNDTLKDTAAANALIAGAGNDTLTSGTAASFIAGGAGNDAITLGSGTAVVAFNSGDGKATITPGTGTSDVLSLGGGIAYANLSFSKSGNNLILNTGGNNSITFTNWYAGAADQNFVNLQVIERAASTYSASSTNVLYNENVEEFSFTQLVSAFNTALAATPSLTSWSLSNALLTDHLSGSNTTALGGDLAYYDGLNGNLTGMNLATAVSTLGSSSYGKTAQTIDAWSGISTSNNKLH
jgi:Ca2+-binding RTX toxin-like protein